MRLPPLFCFSRRAIACAKLYNKVPDSKIISHADLFSRNCDVFDSKLRPPLTASTKRYLTIHTSSGQPYVLAFAGRALTRIIASSAFQAATL